MCALGRISWEIAQKARRASEKPRLSTRARRAGERLSAFLFFFVLAQRVNGENINICGKKAKDESLKKLHRTSAQASAEIMSKQRVLIGACVPH